MQMFNYHTHTYRCGHADSDMKDEEYIEEFIKMGFKEVFFTDHCPEKNKIDKRENMRMEYEQRKEYINSIKALQSKYSSRMKIGVGYEVEYLPGEEKNLKELKQETEKIILGQHFIYDKNGKLKIMGKTEFSNEDLIRYAEYIKEAVKSNIPDIIAHPDIYMLNKRAFGETETKIAKMICEVAEKNNIPLEINLNNIFAKTYYRNRKLNNDDINTQRERLKDVFYPNKEFWNIVTKYNVKVLYGIDAHHRGQILLWNELISLANEILGEKIIKKLKFMENQAK